VSNGVAAEWFPEAGLIRIFYCADRIARHVLTPRDGLTRTGRFPRGPLNGGIPV